VVVEVAQERAQLLEVPRKLPREQRKRPLVQVVQLACWANLPVPLALPLAP
jgi:hypothetical protein